MSKNLLSPQLLSEISTWKTVEVPRVLYHGCRSDDFGINLTDNQISGNKWFSNDQGSVITYATNFHTRKKSTGIPLILEVYCKESLIAIQRPERFDKGDEWISFLAKCFPRIKTKDYALSREFQNTLKSNLDALTGCSVPVQAYLSFEGYEVCIPNCESHIKINNLMEINFDTNS